MSWRGSLTVLSRSSVQRHLVFLCHPRSEPHSAALGVLDLHHSLQEPARPLVARDGRELDRAAQPPGGGLDVTVAPGLQALLDRAGQLLLAAVVSHVPVDLRGPLRVVRPDRADRGLGGGGALATRLTRAARTSFASPTSCGTTSRQTW